MNKKDLEFSILVNIKNLLSITTDKLSIEDRLKLIVNLEDIKYKLSEYKKG